MRRELVAGEMFRLGLRARWVLAAGFGALPGSLARTGVPLVIGCASLVTARADLSSVTPKFYPVCGFYGLHNPGEVSVTDDKWRPADDEPMASSRQTGRNTRQPWLAPHSARLPAHADRPARLPPVRAQRGLCHITSDSTISPEVTTVGRTCCTDAAPEPPIRGPAAR